MPTTPEIIPQGREKADTIVDIGRERLPKEKVPTEVDSWLRKLEQDPQQVMDDNAIPAGAMQATGDGKQSTTMPVTRTTFTKGFKKKVSAAGKWLSVFVLRLIKIKKGKVKFKQDDTQQSD